MRRIGFVGLALSFACQTLVGDYDIRPATATAPLCQVESEKFVLDLDLASEAQLPSLEDYYIRANPALVEHLSGIAHDHLDGAKRRGVTYVLGEAGIGKSYVMRNAFDDFMDAKCDVVLRNLAEDEQADLTTSQGVVFNQLPTLGELSEFNLQETLESQGCVQDGVLKPLVFLDGIDEIHDSSATVVLRAVDEQVLQKSDEFLQIVIAGRPEGFHSWLTDPRRTERNRKVVSLFHLQAPQYRTLGDIEFRLSGYLEYAGDLPEIEARGDFGSYLDSLTQELERFPFLTYSLGNLALGNFAIQHTFPGLNESEQAIKAGILDDWLARNSETHDRPGAGSHLDGMYRRVLEDIAVQYSEVNAQGEFTVGTQDTVTVTDESGKGAGVVQVRDVLLHSGVAYLTVPSSTTTRFRFSPFWLHAFLVEGHNRRQGEPYRGCGAVTAP